MKNIRYLIVRFNNEINLSELHWFRGAVIKAAGQEHILFHNHDEGAGGFRYKYPLIQYKRIRNKAALLCIAEGVEEVNAFFQSMPASLTIGERTVQLQIEHLQIDEATLRVNDQMSRYELSKWLALKPERYREYQALPDAAARTQLLTSILCGNILSMAKGLNWFVEEEIKVQIVAQQPPRIATYKNTPLMAFDLVFETNMWLPKFVGLGKGVALGFGMVEAARTGG
jgi:hypothetical protein